MAKKGDHWYNNGTVQILCADNEVPEGYVKGVLPINRQHLQQISGNQKGVSKSESTKNKISEKAKKRYSNKENHPMYGKHHSLESIEKISNTKSGIESPNKGVKYTEEQIESRNTYIIDKYGSLEAFYKISVENNKESKRLSHNDPNYNNREKASETIKSDKDFYIKRSEKTRETIESRYGSMSNFQKSNRLKCAQRYGFDTVEEYNFYWRNKILKHSNEKESSLEKRVEQFLLNNNFSFVKQYNICNKEFSHTFDFAIVKDGVLEILVDVDGLYFHGYLSDVNGKSVNNYTDDYRQMLVPSDVKFLVIIETEEEKGYSELLRLYGMDYADYVLDVFQWCREEGFPYADDSSKVISNSYKALCDSDTAKFSPKARYGEKVILNFFKSLYSAHKYGKMSPKEAWEDDDVLLDCIKNRIIYKGCNLDRSKVLNGFTVSGIAPKVSIFNPYLAKYLIDKYLNCYDTIFDPFSGYGGRLLGATSLNKHYIGQDINKVTVDESICMAKSLGLNVSLECKDALTSKGKYECLFTCSPYADKEIWGEESETHTCDEWIDICLNNFSCNTYLFVVDKTEKYKDYIVEQIVNKSHFANSVEYVIKIDK